MAGKFKCCKKDANYYWCINCLSIFHSSCLSRMKKIKIIDEFKILCTESCKQNYNDKSFEISKLQNEMEKLKNNLIKREERIETLEKQYENDVKTLQLDIDILQKDIEDRQTHLIREKKRIQEFEEEVYETERNYVDKINEHLSSITKLKKKLATLEIKNIDLQTRIVEFEKDMKEQSEYVKELEDINRSMVNSIRILEGYCKYSNVSEGIPSCEKDRMNTSAKHANGDSKLTPYGNKSPKTTISLSVETNKNTIEAIEKQVVMNTVVSTTNRSQVSVHNKLSNVLIFGDISAKGVSTRMYSCIDSDQYKLYGELQPDGSLLQMSKRIFELSKSYDNRDNVIVCLDLRNHCKLNSNTLKKLFSIGKYTNVIFSLTYGKPNRKQYIEFTNLCQKFLSHQNASIRIFNNNIMNGKYRLSKKNYYRNLVNYVYASCLLENSLVLSNIQMTNNRTSSDAHLVSSNSVDSNNLLNTSNHFLV